MTIKEKVLIVVKAYPTLSSKYGELVCIGAMKEDGSWLRIYPMPFRKFEDYKRFSKYTWIEMPLVNIQVIPDLRALDSWAGNTLFLKHLGVKIIGQEEKKSS